MGSRSVHFVLSTSLTANTAQFSQKMKHLGPFWLIEESIADKLFQFICWLNILLLSLFIDVYIAWGGFGEKNEEDASSHRNVSFTYSGGDVKLIYNRNNLHIKQLDAFCRFLIFLCLRKIRNLFMIWTVWPQLSCIYLFFNFIINKLNQTSSLLIFRLWDYFFPIIRQNEQHYWRYNAQYGEYFDARDNPELNEYLHHAPPVHNRKHALTYEDESALRFQLQYRHREWCDRPAGEKADSRGEK